MIERINPDTANIPLMSVAGAARSLVYRKSTEASAEDLAIMALIDRQYLARPYYGSRRMAAWLASRGHSSTASGCAAPDAAAGSNGNLPAPEYEQARRGA